MRCFLILFVALLAGCASPQPPNVVVILIDDLGWRDTGVYGSPYFRTPAIDRLASEGVRFTRFYAASPVCSPTRASIMTGRDPARLRITNWIGGEQAGALRQADYERQLPLAETTLGEVFAAAGYRTGFIGKWHLGREGFKPRDQGFEYEFAVNDAGQPGSYFPPYENAGWPITNVPDLADDAPGTYLTDRLSEAATGFIASEDERPFLLVMSHYSVHTPLQAPDSLVEQEASRIPAYEGPKWVSEHDRAWANRHQDNATYAAMVGSVDRSVGRILDALERGELARNTIVVFVSDNGGLSTLPRQSERMATSNAPLRAGKGWLFEGGIRVPLVVRWPDALPAGWVTDVPGITHDLLPTLADLAEAGPVMSDGRSLRPALEGAAFDSRDLYWHFPHYHGSGNRPGGAILSGDYKLIEWFEGDPAELFDLAADPNELSDLAPDRPDLVDSLRARLAAWRASVDAAMPSPNPDWPRP